MKLTKPSNRKITLVLVSILVGVLLHSVFVVATAPAPATQTISGGVYSSAPAKYTVWAESGYYYAKDAYGLQPTWSGSTNASYVINAALSYGGQTVLGEGTFYLDGSASIVVTVKGTVLRGAGRILTVLNMSSTTKDVVDVQIDSCWLSDFSVNGGRDGVHIESVPAESAYIYSDTYNNVYSLNAARYGFYTGYPDNTLFQECLVDNSGDNAFYLNGMPNGSVVVTLRNCRTGNIPNSEAIYAEGIAYLTIDGGEFSAAQGGFRGAYIQGAIIRGVNFEEVAGVTTYYNIMRFDGTSGLHCHNILIEGCHFRHGGLGFFIDYTNDLTIQNNWFETIDVNDIVIAGGTEVFNIIYRDNTVDKPSVWADAENITVLNANGVNTENGGSIASCSNGTWIAHGLIGDPATTGSITLALRGPSTYNATFILRAPTVLSSNSTHFQIEFLAWDTTGWTLVPVTAVEGQTVWWTALYKP